MRLCGLFKNLGNCVLIKVETSYVGQIVSKEAQLRRIVSQAVLLGIETKLFRFCLSSFH